MNHDYTSIGINYIASSSTIQGGTLIGKPFRYTQNGQQEEHEPVTIGENCRIGHYCTIGSGTEIFARCIIDDFSILESYVSLGENSIVIYRAQICNEVRIGTNCVIGGLVGERTTVGNYCRIFGDIVHSQTNPMIPWDDEDLKEEPVTLHDRVFIGFKSVVAGGISIGPRAYILAGSLITKNIPADHIAWGRNEMTHYTKWSGKLRNSDLFK